MADVKAIMKMIEENDVQYVDFRFSDPRGKLQHTAQHVSTVDEDLLTEGIMFDGSSIAGWKAINESDMILIPDLSTAHMDPFAAQPLLNIFCDVYEPSTGQPYSRDPRSTAKAAEAYLASTGIGDTAFFGPEAEFFVFDDVRIKVDQNHVMYKIDSEEGPYNSGSEFPDGNLGHRPGPKGGYFPVGPVDSMSDLRAEMVSVLASIGVPVEKHHHEVAPSQNELGIKFDTMVKCADNMQLYKYVVHNVADAYGKTATFMPKPVFGDNGSGMHVHQSIWKGNEPTFAGSGYADLSETALYYIGGIIKHAKALNAFTNASTNSYKRLVPGYEAPVLLAYSSRNRSASCRIPYVTSPKAKRVEVRFPDPTANPYLAFAAMLMAGLDGIQNKIHPGDAMDKNLYDLPPEELADVPTVCGSLREALESLAADHEFLLKGDVFNKEQIEGYIELKMEEVEAFETMPHPIEYSMYYSV
ncbi:MAG: type I glutamate--ammonia ligase [Alphaproteobacteria bacterium]|nr:type I glutamate--ammonia ligase [Alphaproteobacteria bacterium]MAS46103.1 type I glutamate--ammonia ligase [Alphaproteobacteria bacterium]MAX95714.1 type I glutamate--ammonia ligase [Alphaproteobacteria bacterium]MBN54151.1 type I glutamate--ammonia ligase [Alphaproteobacteria bacterium]OUT42265.1 MAG: type I glutamate--ammonia ligase [Micavibrio sp. TMED2]|tara:strand:+ start:22713 stop:24122 length:1410 start_codon:yes stop_codon:yes gene_type:complete